MLGKLNQHLELNLSAKSVSFHYPRCSLIAPDLSCFWYVNQTSGLPQTNCRVEL